MATRRERDGTTHYTTFNTMDRSGRRDPERHPQKKQARRQTVTYTQTHPFRDGERQEDIRNRDA